MPVDSSMDFFCLLAPRNGKTKDCAKFLQRRQFCPFSPLPCRNHLRQSIACQSTRCGNGASLFSEERVGVRRSFHQLSFTFQLAEKSSSNHLSRVFFHEPVPIKKRCLILFDFVVIDFCFVCFCQFSSFIKAPFYRGSCFILLDARGVVLSLWSFWRL
jgi:hypothetical protein